MEKELKEFQIKLYMDNINLVTTSIKNQYQKGKKNFVLGDWCEDKNNVKNIINNKNVYHWDNYIQRDKDLIFLKKFNDELINYFQNRLNAFYELKYSQRFWQIILMPWIWIYTASLYDRWKIITSIQNQKNLQFNYIPYDKKTFVMNDLSDFKRSISQSYWTEFVFGEAIKFKDIFNIQNSKKFKKNKINNLNKNVSKKNFNEANIFKKNTLNKLNKSSIFIRSLYLSKLEKIKLYLVNGNFLPFYEKTYPLSDYEYLEDHRNNILSHKHNKKDFKNFAYSLIKYTFPKCYFEGLKETIEVTKKLNWPINPKYILTSNAYDSDEIFKFYTALNIEKKCKFYIFQHGGNLGTSRFHLGEEVQRDLSDKYFTWGWKEKRKDVPFYLSTLNIKKVIKKKERKGLIIPIVEIQRFPAKIESSPRMRRDAKIYTQNILNFFSSIPKKIQQNSVIKYVSPFKKINIETNTYVIDTIKKKYRKNVIISNQNTLELSKNFILNIEFVNSTGFYECICSNIPTILILDKRISKIRKKAENDFKILNKNKIFFYDYKAAANFVTNNYTNLEKWWYSKKIQKVLNKFRKKFARQSSNKIKILNELINEKIF